MADFDRAAERLSQRNTKNARTTARSVLSAKASREAARQKALQQQRAIERAKKEQHERYLKRYLQECKAHFGIEPLINASQQQSQHSLQLQPTSIHGQGDKIALPPSVLEYLTSNDDQQHSSPWTFRIGIRNPDYQFPASTRLAQLTEDDDEDDENYYQPFCEELQQQYRAYTHGTVVEFTQEEGHVGLPAPIAQALLSNSGGGGIAVTRTVDPSKQEDDDDAMENDDTTTTTPGHIAWGAFDLPDALVEITLIRHLPKGTSARLCPSVEAIRNGFYRLHDIKLVLEQSLIRTRATLSVHDTLYTWHRGIQFELQVVQVEPTEYGSVSCINTDIEIEFEQPTLSKEKDTMESTHDNDTAVASGTVLGGGRRLADATPTPPTALPAPAPPAPPVSLPDEPPANSPDAITLQLRFPDGTKRQYRFHVDTATLQQVWTWANVAPDTFQLVTRFPRRVWTTATSSTLTLRQAGLQPGQEVLWLERR